MGFQKSQRLNRDEKMHAVGDGKSRRQRGEKRKFFPRSNPFFVITQVRFQGIKPLELSFRLVLTS